jgi:endothelin-converting enzyme/putative endopeptidase
MPRFFLFLAALASAAAQITPTPAPGNKQLVGVSGEFAPQGIDLSTISHTLRPGDDFFSYVNEGWINRTTKIPDDHWDYGQTDIVGAIVDTQIKNLVAASVADPSPRGSPAQQVGDAYTSFTDIGKIEQRGLKAVQSDLKGIVSSGTREEIARWMADPMSSSLFAINLFPAEGVWRVCLDQSNLSLPMLGLPNRDAYERTDESSVSHRAAFQAYIAGLFEKSGIDDAPVRAAHVLALETRIAANQWGLEKLRDRRANYHPMTVEELIRYAPGFPLARVSEIPRRVAGFGYSARHRYRGAGASPAVCRYSSGRLAILSRVPLATEPDRRVPRAFRQSSWAFHGQTLSNAKSEPSREDTAWRLVNTLLGATGGQTLRRALHQPGNSGGRRGDDYLSAKGAR